MVVQGRDRVGDGLLAEVEDVDDVVLLLGAGADARVDLAELGHDGQHLLLNDLRGVFGACQVRLVGAEHDWDVDAERAEVGHPEQGDALVAVVVGVD